MRVPSERLGLSGAVWQRNWGLVLPSLKLNMDGGSPGVLESGAGAEPLLQALDAPGVKPGAGQCFHSWGNYLHTNGRMLHIHG